MDINPKSRSTDTWYCVAKPQLNCNDMKITPIEIARYTKKSIWPLDGAGKYQARESSHSIIYPTWQEARDQLVLNKKCAIEENKTFINELMRANEEYLKDIEALKSLTRPDALL